MSDNFPITVAAITETSGPTSLVIGDVADGEFLKRDGSTLVGAAAGGSSVSFNAKRIATWQAVQVGDIVWDGVKNQTNDGLYEAVSTVDGYYSRRYTDGTADEKAGFRYTADWFATQDHPIYWAKIRTGSALANHTIWLGCYLVLPTKLAACVGEHLMLRYVNGTDTYLSLSTCDSGGTQTVTATTVEPTVDTAYIIKVDATLYPTSVTLEIYDKDMTLLDSIVKTTNLPDAATLLRPIFRVANQALGAVELLLGKVQLEVD